MRFSRLIAQSTRLELAPLEARGIDHVRGVLGDPSTLSASHTVRVPAVINASAGASPSSRALPAHPVAHEALRRSGELASAMRSALNNQSVTHRTR